jgi:TMEM175 potassium channel family protein
MSTTQGLHRLTNFSDAVVAIAITLLILPLVDSASDIGKGSVATFLHHHDTQLLAFGLSFAVIWSFWWSQHQMLERIVSYNRPLVIGMFLWILSIVFLPFPTELLSSASQGGQGVHALYVGTMLVTSVAVLVQESAIVMKPELQAEDHRGEAGIAEAVVLVMLMAVILVVVITIPAVGMWSLFILLLSRPIVVLVRMRHGGKAGAVGGAGPQT